MITCVSLATPEHVYSTVCTWVAKEMPPYLVAVRLLRLPHSMHDKFAPLAATCIPAVPLHSYKANALLTAHIALCLFASGYPILIPQAQHKRQTFSPNQCPMLHPLSTSHSLALEQRAVQMYFSKL